MAKSTQKPITTANVAHITPQILTWAINRSSVSRESLAKRLGVALVVLRSWEQGTPPPLEKAEELSTLLRIPFGYFYLSKPPDASVPLPDMRRLGIGYKPTQNLLDLLQDVMIRRDWFLEYIRDSREEPLPFVGKFTANAGVAEVAADIRRTLELGPALRHRSFSWSDYGASVTKQAERKRMLVMRSGVVGNDRHRSISREEVQGFAIADKFAPVIFVNASDYKAAQVFTLAHELAHIWIGESAISNPNEGEIRAAHAIERFCNSVATEVLVPEAEFGPAWRVKKNNANRIEELARLYWVSQLVIIRRAHELGHLTADDARQLRNKAISKQRHTKEEKGTSTYYKVAAVRAGHVLTDAVISEVVGGNVVLSHGARLLSMNPHTLARRLGG